MTGEVCIPNIDRSGRAQRATVGAIAGVGAVLLLLGPGILGLPPGARFLAVPAAFFAAVGLLQAKEKT